MSRVGLHIRMLTQRDRCCQLQLPTIDRVVHLSRAHLRIRIETRSTHAALVVT